MESSLVRAAKPDRGPQAPEKASSSASLKRQLNRRRIPPRVLCPERLAMDRCETPGVAVSALLDGDKRQGLAGPVY